MGEKNKFLPRYSKIDVPSLVELVTPRAKKLRGTEAGKSISDKQLRALENAVTRYKINL